MAESTSLPHQDALLTLLPYLLILATASNGRWPRLLCSPPGPMRVMTSLTADNLPQEGNVVGHLDAGLAAAVTIATYNEAENLPELLKRLLDLEPPVGAVVVDDASPDGTGRLADAWAERAPGRVVVIHREGKAGYGSAIQRGLAYAYLSGMPALLTMDADHSHDPAAVPALIGALSEYDVAIGSRYVRGGRVENWPPQRVVLSRLGGAFARLATGMPFRDPTSGFRAYKPSALAAIDIWSLRVRGYSFLMEALFRAWVAGLKVVEIPIVFRDRTAGRSKLSRKIILEAFLVALRLGWTRRWRPALRRYKEEMGRWSRHVAA